MKKVLFFLAVAGVLSFVACKSGETKTEATADTTAQVQQTVDSTAAPAADTTAVK